MKVLVLSAAGKALDNSPMWRALADHVEVELHFLDKAQQQDLRKWFRPICVESFDRIVLDLMFKHIHGQRRWLSSLPNLVVYEEDAYLNFMQGSKWLGAFSAFYRKFPRIRVISTGAWVTAQLKTQQIDAHFLPKGFDANRLYDRKLSSRDISLGFVGRLASSAYAGRQKMLKDLSAVAPLQLLRTSRPEEYPELLNRIRCFVSADIGLREYMAKNFEAMACGCLLLAKRQGEGEEQALGLIDGQNLLLYDDLPSLMNKLEWIRLNPEQVGVIASAGSDWVLRNNEYASLARKFSLILAIPLTSSESANRKWWKWW